MSRRERRLRKRDRGDGKDSRGRETASRRPRDGAPYPVPEHALRALAESGALVAIIVSVLFFDPLSDRGFDPSKVRLSRVLCFLPIGALLVWMARTDRARVAIAVRGIVTRPIVIGALALTVSFSISTFLSAAPGSSWWGFDVRLQGFATHSAYLALFFALLAVAREPMVSRRVVDIVLIASLGSAGYALLQSAGLDPIEWQRNPSFRVEGAAGNPIFLGGMLIMVAPLALASALACPHGFRRLVYAVLLAVYLATLWLARSRGPLLAMLVGAVLFAALWLTRCRPRWAVAACAVAGVGAIAALLAVITGIVDPRDPTFLQRPESRTDTSRLLIWQAASELWGESPLRRLVGHGPETLWLLIHRVYPGALAAQEGPAAVPDRAHSESWDTLISMGAVGLVIQTGLFLAIFASLLRSLGWLDGAWRKAPLPSIVGCAAFGGILVAGLDHGAATWPLGVSLSLVAGLFVTILGIGISRRSIAPSAPDSDDFLAMGLLAAVGAHFVEVQIGIATAESRSLFWLSAALAAAIGLRRGVREPTAPGGSRFFGWMVGAVLIVLTCTLGAVPLSRQAAGVGLVLLAMVWMTGLLLVADDAHGAREARLGAMRLFTITSLGPLLAFGPLYLLRTQRTVAEQQADALVWVYAGTLLLAVVAALDPLRVRTRQWRVAWRPLRLPYRIGAVVGLIAVVSVFVNSFEAALGHRYTWMAEAQARRGNGNAANDFSRLAYEEAPAERWSALQRVRLLRRARAEPAEKGVLLSEAERILSDLVRSEPRDAVARHEHVQLQLARLRNTSGKAERARHLPLVLRSYEDLLAVSPRMAVIWNGYAGLLRRAGRDDEALDAVERSVELAPRFGPSHRLRGDILSDRGDYPTALASYDRALSLPPRRREGWYRKSWIGKAYVLAKMGRTEEAIDANRRVAEMLPEDAATAKNLAILYRQADDPESAREWAERARDLVPPGEREELERFIAPLP